MRLPNRVRIVEVGPRDGLQNEKQMISTDIKVELIRRLVGTGLKIVEATAFVSPKWVPQMSDHAEVLNRIGIDAPRGSGCRFSVLTPNMQGFEAALAAGAREVAVFASASEAFSQKNINCSIKTSLERFRPLVAAAQTAGIQVRGYVSCVTDCPYEGPVAPEKVARVAVALSELGCYEISLGDTIGTGNPVSIQRMLETVLRELPAGRLAGHYHNTYGVAIANIYASLRMGVATFDASVGGLGGCPYAAGASGNVATEDVVWLMNGLGIDTGIDIDALVAVAAWISGQLGRKPGSKVAQALGYACR